MFYEVKISYLAGAQFSNSGLPERKKTKLLVDAMSVTEAEARAVACMEGMGTQMSITGAAESRISEVVPGDGDVWHKVKLCYSESTEDGGKEKKVTSYLLVRAFDVQHAFSACEEHLKSMLVPFRLPSVSEAGIEDVVFYKP